MSTSLYIFYGFGWHIKEDKDKYLDYLTEDEYDKVTYDGNPFIHLLCENDLFIGFSFGNDYVSDYETFLFDKKFSYSAIQERLQVSYTNFDKWWDEYFGECPKPAEEPMFCIFPYYAY